MTAFSKNLGGEVNKIGEIQKLTGLAENLLRKSTNLPDDKHMSEARFHLRQAIKCLEEAGSSRSKKQAKSTQFESWWGNVVSGTAKMSQSPVSNQAYTRSLNVLQSMINQEESKITDIETQISNTQKVSIERNSEDVLFD
jgi:hypothetical protein